MGRQHLLAFATTAAIVVTLAAPASATDRLLRSMNNATIVAASGQTQAWSVFSHSRFKLVLARDTAVLRTVDVGRRGVPLDLAVGTLAGRSVAIWSACKTEPRRTKTVPGVLPDYSTGRGCRLRAYDTSSHRSRTIPTGDGAAFLPALSPTGDLLFFRRAHGVTKLLRQRADGTSRKVLATISGSPTSLSLDGASTTWTTSRPAEDGNTSAVYVQRPGGSITMIDQRGVAMNRGVQVTSASVAGDTVRYLAQGLGGSISQLVQYSLTAGHATAQSPAPANAESAAPLNATETLVATATTTKSHGPCPQSISPSAPTPIDPRSGCSLVISS